MSTRLTQPDSLKPLLHLNNTATELTQFATDLCDISHGKRKKKTNKEEVENQMIVQGHLKSIFGKYLFGRRFEI